MEKKKIAIALLGSVFAGSGLVALNKELNRESPSLSDYVDFDEYSKKPFTAEELKTLFAPVSDAEIEELLKPMIFDHAPCPTADAPNKECLVLKVQEP